MSGIVNAMFGNRTQSNLIHGLSSYEFSNQTKSNTEFSVSLISKPIKLKLNKLNLIKLNPLDCAIEFGNQTEWIAFDCHSSTLCVRNGLQNDYLRQIYILAVYFGGMY